MFSLFNTKTAALFVAGSLAILSSGCGYYHRAVMLYEPAAPPSPIGSINDEIWQNQEANAEASEFVIYQHEFQLNTPYLNLGGQDHVKQIAARTQAGQDLPVIIERSMTSSRKGTEFKLPVHPNPDLDMLRRKGVVAALTEMGVADAENRVVVAPALAEGYTANEARMAYWRGLWSGIGGGFGNGGIGGFGGGIGGFGGGIGGFGGGFGR